jgi:hypothetical protein
LGRKEKPIFRLGNNELLLCPRMKRVGEKGCGVEWIMRRAVTHQRVSVDVSVDRVNRVNRAQHGDRTDGESAVRTGKSTGQVWRNIGSLGTLLARAERELAREPGAYVAVAVVHGDKREEQSGR